MFYYKGSFSFMANKFGRVARNFICYKWVQPFIINIKANAISLTISTQRDIHLTVAMASLEVVKIKMVFVWFGLVLWHINHYWLFNAKFSLYIYIRYIWFGLVGFYGISTIIGYLMPNSLYTLIKYIWFENIFCW